MRLGMGIGASTATEESQSQVPHLHRGLPQAVPALLLPAGPFASHEFLSQERVPVLGPCVPALFLGKGPSQWEIQSTWGGVRPDGSTMGPWPAAVCSPLASDLSSPSVL